jgi:energy-dependent translational throttle protein EttA
VLLEEPDMLLLDEPTNHLDAESVAWLERYLADFEGHVVAITHDRYFLDNVAKWILELDRGAGYPVGGQLLVWLEQKRERLRQEEKQESVAPADAAARAGMDPHGARRGSPRARPASTSTSRPAQRRTAEKLTRRPRSSSPPGSALGGEVSRRTG